MLTFFCMLVSITYGKQVSKPNILMMVIDDLGYTDISYNGAEYPTPNIDELIANGVQLTNYYVHCTCSPTRSSFFTGKYSWKTGLQRFNTIPAGSTEHIPYEFPTMAELLSKSGWKSHAIGKWHLGMASWNMTPIERGFDSFFGYLTGAQYYYNHTSWLHNTTMTGYDFINNKSTYWDAFGKYGTDLYYQQMEHIIENHTLYFSDQPLFIYMAFQTIHTPIVDVNRIEDQNPPKEYDECNNNKNITREGRKVYCNKMKYLDEYIGKIIQLYKTYKLYNNTVIVGTTDNGGLPWWNPNPNGPITIIQSWGCNYPYRGGKGSLFEGGVKGMGFISGQIIKDRGLNGIQSNILVHAMDWLPTFVEGIAGDVLPYDKTFDGINMWNALGNDAIWNRTVLYVDIEVVQPIHAIINGSWKYINYTKMESAYYSENGWYLCNGSSEYAEPQHLYLFDIKNDPFEKNNLIHQNRDVAIELENMIQYQIHFGDYYPEQDSTIYVESEPQYHNGTWIPWLD
eukprot:525929_1